MAPEAALGFVTLILLLLSSLSSGYWPCSECSCPVYPLTTSFVFITSSLSVKPLYLVCLTGKGLLGLTRLGAAVSNLFSILAKYQKHWWEGSQIPNHSLTLGEIESLRHHWASPVILIYSQHLSALSWIWLLEDSRANISSPSVFINGSCYRVENATHEKMPIWNSHLKGREKTHFPASCLHPFFLPFLHSIDSFYL